MFELLICQLSFQIISNGIVFAIKAEIVHYPNVTLDGCGIGRESQLMDDTCFEWHNSRDISQSSIMDGRDVQNGEMPFTVSLHFSLYEYDADCSGTIINQEWVITAAHCVYNSTEMEELRVYPGLRHMQDLDEYEQQGKGIAVDQYFVHPEYLTAQYDVALLKLNRTIELDTKGPYTNLNSVCLPNYGNDYYGVENEWTLFSGWGLIDENTPNTNSMQMGWGAIMPNSSGAFIDIEYMANQPTICSGDSGGTLIQYSKGRAVLIGVAMGAMNAHNSSGCPVENNTILIMFLNVSKFIPWIVDTIVNNTSTEPNTEPNTGY